MAAVDLQLIILYTKKDNAPWGGNAEAACAVRKSKPQSIQRTTAARVKYERLSTLLSLMKMGKLLKPANRVFGLIGG